MGQGSGLVEVELSDVSGRSWFPQDAPSVGEATPPKRTKRSDNERATQVALQFRDYLMGKAALLRRPVVLDDLTEQELHAFGYALGHRGRIIWPPSLEDLKRVARVYLKAKGNVPTRFSV
jgi:hypothetical protein